MVVGLRDHVASNLVIWHDCKVQNIECVAVLAKSYVLRTAVLRRVEISPLEYTALRVSVA